MICPTAQLIKGLSPFLLSFDLFNTGKFDKSIKKLLDHFHFPHFIMMFQGMCSTCACAILLVSGSYSIPFCNLFIKFINFLQNIYIITSSSKVITFIHLLHIKLQDFVNEFIRIPKIGKCA